MDLPGSYKPLSDRTLLTYTLPLLHTVITSHIHTQTPPQQHTHIDPLYMHVKLAL